MKLLRSTSLLAALLLLSVHHAFSADPSSVVAGRESDTLASAYVSTEIDGSKSPVLLVYFQGAPGWHLGLPHTRIESQKTILAQLEIGGRDFSAELTSDVQTVYVMGKKFDLGASNVFLVREADGVSPTVEPLGRVDLGSKVGETSLPESIARAYPSIAEAVGLDR